MELISLRLGEVQTISPPVSTALLTGVHYITYNPRKFLLTLFYPDNTNTKESADMPVEDFEEASSYFALVQYVQSKRKV